MGSPRLRSAQVVLLALLACRGRVEDFDPVPPHPWAPFGAGSWVLRRETLESDGREQSSEEKWEVLERTADAARLRISLTIDGKTETRELVVSLKNEPLAFATVGEEKIYVGVTEYRCAIREQGGVRRWTTKEIPEWPVKEIETNGPEATLTRLVRRGERVRIGAHEVACDVFEEVQTSGHATVWRSKDVPGQIVKKEMILPGAGGERRVVMRVADYEVKR